MHVFCTWFDPDFRMGNSTTMSPVVQVNDICSNRAALRCSLCDSEDGVCIQCAHGRCSAAFHSMCAHRRQLTRIVCSKTDIYMEAFCPEHYKCPTTDIIELSTNQKRASAPPTPNRTKRPRKQSFHKITNEPANKKMHKIPNEPANKSPEN